MPTHNAMLPPLLDTLGRAQLQKMYLAGNEILSCYQALSKAGLNVVGEILRDSLNRGETFYELTHYPENDVYDPDSHAQYYYHAHRSDAGEHGHFHCFLNSPGMPHGVSPLAQADAPHNTHLIAIAMDEYGFPNGLFTTNRWVTAESWYPAEQVIHMLDAFVIDHAYPSWPVNRWISAMLILFRPYIEHLLKQRDSRITQWQHTHQSVDVYEDRELEVTSYLSIDVGHTLQEIMTLLVTKSSHPTK